MEGLAKISYDPESDILYVRVREGLEHDVLEEDDAEVYVDEKGGVLAVEVWNASRNGLDEIIKLLTLKPAAPP